jgi:hypothetical protein
VATIAPATEIDGRCCALNDWGSRSRKSTKRRKASVLRGCGGTVSRETGAAARSGVASRCEIATTAGSEFIGQALTGRPQRVSNDNPMRAQARCLGTTRTPQFMPKMARLKTTPPELGELCPFPAVVLDCPKYSA